jgi:hypothetical protein
MTLTTDTLQFAALGLVLLAVIGIAFWLSAKLRAATREIHKAIASSRHAVPVPANVLTPPPRQSGPFWEKQQDVYAGLYTRYRRACDRALPRQGLTPDFSRFSRDELLRYLARRKVRERDATDAIAALDRGDSFAMTRLMTRLHDRVNQRDASLALQRAAHFEEIHELYLSDAVRSAVHVLRARLTPEEAAGQPTGERRSQTAGGLQASEREIRDALADLQRAMRAELGGDQPVAAAPKPAPARLPAPVEQTLPRNVHVDAVRAEHKRADD